MDMSTVQFYWKLKFCVATSYAYAGSLPSPPERSSEKLISKHSLRPSRSLVNGRRTRRRMEARARRRSTCIPDMAVAPHKRSHRGRTSLQRVHPCAEPPGPPEVGVLWSYPSSPFDPIDPGQKDPEGASPIAIV